MLLKQNKFFLKKKSLEIRKIKIQKTILKWIENNNNKNNMISA